MEQAIRGRVYPPRLRPPLWRRQLRFWQSLVSSVAQRGGLRKVRSTLLLTSPEFLRQLAWGHYVSPLRDYRPVALSPRAQEYVEQLRRDGIVVFDRNFADLADYIRTRYFSAEFVLPSDSPKRVNGLEVSHAVSLADRRLHEVLFDPEICGIICNYYGRQAYYRDNPTVHKERAAPGSKPLISGVFHSDAYRQVSSMLLLSDLTESDTHMEFARASHGARQPSYDRSQIDQAAVAREFEMVHVVGRKGTLFIFDTEGLHRGAYHSGTGREMFHVNMTTGTWPFTDAKYDDLSSIFPDPQALPEHVRNFVARAVK